MESKSHRLTREICFPATQILMLLSEDFKTRFEPILPFANSKVDSPSASNLTVAPAVGSVDEPTAGWHSLVHLLVHSLA